MKKLVVFISLNIVCALFALAQHSAFRKANMHYDNYDFAEAAELYEKVDAKNPSDTVKAKIARCYYRMNKMDEVDGWY